MSQNIIERLKREFLQYLEIERGRSLRTVDHYDRYLSRFFEFRSLREPGDITEEAVRRFRLYLNRQLGRRSDGGESSTLKHKTQNYYLIALRSFLRYLSQREIPSLPPQRIELAKVGERSLDLISVEEVERMIHAASGTDLKGQRDRAILELLFSTGLRVSELCALPRDLDLRRDEISVRGKGERVRVVFLSAAAKEAIKRYLAVRNDIDDALFIQIGNAPHKLIGKEGPLRLTARSVERIVKYYAVKAGITTKVTPHSLRHVFATDLLENGADLRSVQALLGHAHIGTTQIYTHVTDKHLRDVHRAFHRRRGF